MKAGIEKKSQKGKVRDAERGKQVVWSKKDKEGGGCVIYAWGSPSLPVWLPADTLT